MTSGSLPIAGYRGEPVPNTFLRQDGASAHLALLLPGFGYTCDMPLFYYATKLLLAAGADLLAVEYAYNRRPDFRRLPEPDQREWLFADVDAAFQAGRRQRAYAEITLVGKSLGTLAMGHLLAAPERPAATARAVWLTPLLRLEPLRRAIAAFAGPSLFVIGSADPHYDPAALDQAVAATGGEAVAIDGADHGLDLPGDPAASVRALERVVRTMAAFLESR